MACVYLELSSWRWTSFCAHRCRECVGPQLWFWQWHSMGQTDSSERQPLWLLSSKTFSKITLTVGSTWCTSLVLLFVVVVVGFFLWSFFFNVAQRGIMEKGTLKAPPPPAGRPSRALRPSGGSSPCLLVSGSKDESSTLLSWKKDHSYVSLSRVYLFQSASSHSSSHPPFRAVRFAFQICVSYFMVFWVAQDQLFLKFFTFESEEQFERRALL